MNITERINRILYIMSYVKQNQGVPVTELAEKVGMRPRQLLKELDFMLLIGKPPFRPDDYVDIYVEEERVYVEFDQMLNRPLRFTRPEAMALLLSLQILDPEVDPEAVASLKGKIQRAIDSSLDPSWRLEDRVLLEKPSRPVSDRFLLLRQAAEGHRKVEIAYYSLTRNKTTRRVVHPYFLLKHLGYWYLTGYCEARKDLRTFKFERILSVNLQNKRFPSPRDFDPARYKEDFLKAMGRQRVEIHIKAAIAPWVRERWGNATRPAPDEGIVLTLFCETLEYPSRLILSYSPHARALHPPELIEKVRQDVAEIHQLYSEKVVS